MGSVDTFSAAVRCHHVKMDQNLSLVSSRISSGQKLLRKGMNKLQHGLILDEKERKAGQTNDKTIPTFDSVHPALPADSLPTGEPCMQT